jgi:hypothetical protein
VNAAERAQRRAELRERYREAKARELEAAGELGLAAEVLAGRCACGCDEPLVAPSVRTFYKDGHRKRRHRRRVERAARAAGLPTHLSLESVQTTVRTRERRRDAPARPQAPQRRRKPDLRVSYRKAVEAVASHVGDPAEAEGVLRPLLSPAQLRSLEERAA